MRIGFDASKALAARDGIGRYVRELLRALVELDAEIGAGLKLELYGLPVGTDEPTARKRLWDLPVGLHFDWQIAADAIDVFHSTALNVPPGFRGPMVCTCHDLTFLTHPEFHTLENKVYCLKGLLRANLAGAHFLAVSHATAQSMEQELGIPADRVTVVHHAPTPDLQPLPQEQARQQLEERFGIPGAPVLAVGTLEPRKNLERLIDAYLGLDENLRQAHPLVIAGGGGWRNQTLLARFEALRGSASSPATVHRLDPSGDAELSLLYSAAAVFAYPSLAEGFGLPIVEAMACGAPVVTSNLSSLPEVAGDAARLVDPLDVGAIRHTLDQLLRDPDARLQLSDLGRQRASSFSWAETARQTLDLYRRLLPEDGTG